MDNIDTAVAEFRQMESEAFAEQLNLPGWEYRDLPNMAVEYMDQFKDMVGDDNVRWITFAERRWPDNTVTQRGQVMISPDGMRRIREYNARLK